MKITVCIGSSCHMKGARSVVEQLQNLISEFSLGDKLVLEGASCNGQCQNGVCVTVDGEQHSVTPENAADFFRKSVAARMTKEKV